MTLVHQWWPESVRKVTISGNENRNVELSVSLHKSGSLEVWKSGHKNSWNLSEIDEVGRNIGCMNIL